jgi:hypothetical protein
MCLQRQELKSDINAILRKLLAEEDQWIGVLPTTTVSISGKKVSAAAIRLDQDQARATVLKIDLKGAAL